jgi:outer membrane protein OmpA-like peptidoglycan-associated protein
MAIRPEKTKSTPAILDEPGHSENGSSNWFLVSDSGRAFLRIRPGLHIGESQNGQLVVGDGASADHWLGFHFDGTHMWVETTSDSVRLSCNEIERLEQQRLQPGLVLSLPHNRLVVSQEGLVCSPVAARPSAQRLSVNHTKPNLIRAKEAHGVSTPVHEPSAGPASKSQDRRVLPRVIGVMTALVLLASPVILSHLQFKPSTSQNVELLPVETIEPPAVKSIEPPPVETVEKVAPPPMLRAVIPEKPTDPPGAIVRGAETIEALQASPSVPTSSETTAEQGLTVKREAVIEETAIAASTLFAFDSAELSADAKRVIDEHVLVLKNAEPSASILRIEGHTDSIGPEVYNLYLSRLRAEAVADYLVSQNYFEDAASIEALGKGELEPAAPNDTREGRMANRRVVIVTERMISR